MNALHLQSVSFVTIGPPLIVAIAALVVLVADVLVPATEEWRPRRRSLSMVLSMVGVLAAAGWAIGLAASGARATFCSQAGCFYGADQFTAYLQILVLAAVAVVLLLSRASVVDDDLPPGEFGFLLLTSVVGMLVLPASRDLITLVIALEVVTLPGFVLVGLRRSDGRSAQAAVTYFIFSIVATALTIYGIALIYGVTGGLTFGQVSHGLAAVVSAHHDHRAPLAAAATILVTVGFSFKIAAVPFHAWAPDTYQGAPLPVAAMLSTASKVAGFAGLIIVLFGPLSPEDSVWGPVVAALAIASMTVGNVVALRQWQAVRLLGWSTVAQAGYLLVPLAVAASSSGRTAGSLHDGVEATLAYLGIYVAMNLGAFAVLAAVRRRVPRLAIEDLRGLARTSPGLAVALALFFTALAGLPPGVAGLIAKVVMLRAAVDGHVTWLAVIAAVNAVIGLAYYLRVAAMPFLGLGDDNPDAEHGGEPDTDRSVDESGRPSRLSGASVAVAIAAVAVVWLSVYPEPLLHAASAAASAVVG